MRGDATRMETYIDLDAVVYVHKHCTGIFARSKLTMEAIRSMHGKSISSIDSAQPTMAHDADTASDFARPPDVHQIGTLLRLGYCGVLRAGAPPAICGGLDT